MVTFILSGSFASRLRMIFWVPVWPSADAVDRQPGRELAGEVAVEPDDHRAEAQVAERVEGDIAHHPEVRAVDDAIVGEAPAAGPRIEPAADDPPAIFVEDHRQHAVEHAGRVELGEAHRGYEDIGVEPDDLERQPLGGRPSEIEHGFLQDQAPAHERPFAALDPDQLVGQQLIGDHPILDEDAGVDRGDAHLLAGRGRQG